jgi:xanthosine utilization system XapX-like protein
VGSTTMTVSVVPAPGAIALIGIAGIAAGGRRRR